MMDSQSLAMADRAGRRDRLIVACAVALASFALARSAGATGFGEDVGLNDHAVGRQQMQTGEVQRVEITGYLPRNVSSGVSTAVSAGGSGGSNTHLR